MRVTSNDNLIRLLVLVGLLILWHLIVVTLKPNLLPSPLDVFERIQAGLRSNELSYHLGATLLRVAISFTVAMIVGFAIGLAMGWSRWCDRLLDVPITLALNIPALVVIILCFVWFGLNDFVAVFAVILNKTPMVIVTIREGVKSVDKGLLEVAKVFHLSKWKTFWQVLMPQYYPYISTCVRNGLSLIWKIVLVVELLGCSNGVGFKLGIFFQYFDIANILAYTFAFVFCVLLIETLIVRPLEQRAERWRYD